MTSSIEEERAGAAEEFRPQVSVVVCAYSNERLPQLKETIASLKKQTYAPSEIVLIVDHNPELQAELERTAGDSLRIAPNTGDRGLANARNTGISLATGELVAFIDDDAAADGRWLEELVACYQDPAVIGAGGRIDPVWEGGAKPAWMPEEFLWVIGCSYRGMAEGNIRNMIGCNMSFRSSVFEEVGVFNPDIGRLGKAVLFRGRLEGGRAQTVGRRGDERRGRLPLSNATERSPARGRQSYSAQGSRPFRITDWYDGARRRGCWGRLCIRACAREDRPAVRAAFLRLLHPFRDAQLLRETDVSNAG